MRETPLALATFAQYCALGPERSLAKLAQKLGKPSGYTRQLETWSAEFGWQERVKPYDAERIEEKRRKQEAEIERMNERHALIGTTQQAKAIKQIEALIEAKAFGSMAAVQLLKLATDLERLSRGAPTQQVEMNAAISGQIGFYPVLLPQKDSLEEGGDSSANRNAPTN